MVVRTERKERSLNVHGSQAKNLTHRSIVEKHIVVVKDRLSEYHSVLFAVGHNKGRLGSKSKESIVLQAKREQVRQYIFHPTPENRDNHLLTRKRQFSKVTTSSSSAYAS
jgi:hypothetical protein